MSTRCQLAIYEHETDPVEKPTDGVFIYRHSDGYPDGVLPDIIPFLDWFNQERGIGDTSYCAARLLAHLVWNHDRQTAELYKRNGEAVSNFGDILGFGIDDAVHADIDYFYHISPVAVRVLKVTYGKAFNRLPSAKWEEVKRHPFAPAAAESARS